MKKVLFLLWLLSILTCCNQNSNKLPEYMLKELNIDDSPVYMCQEKNVEFIDLNGAFGNDYLSIDDLLDTLYVVSLQTTDDNVFYGIAKIEMCDDRIFIEDQDDRILVFDNNGKFINKLNQGQGPGEIFDLYDFSFDETTQHLVVTQPDLESIYDKDGVFIESKYCPIVNWEFSAVEWGYVFFAPKFVNIDLGDNAKHSVLVTDKSIKVIGKGIGLPQAEGFVRCMPYMYKSDGNVIVSQPGNDTIFELSDSQISAKYVLNFSTEEINVRSPEEVTNSSKYYHSSGFMENNKTQFFHFRSAKSGSYTVLRDKNTKQTLGAAHFMSSPEVVPLYCVNIMDVYNDYFVSYMNPYNNMHFNSPKIAKEDNDKIANLTEEDNAVIIFFKIKDWK